MPEFKVPVTRTQIALATVMVDAATQQEAEARALEFAHEAEFRTQDAEYELTNGPKKSDAFDGIPCKAVIVEACTTHEHGSSPTWAMLEAGPALMRQLTVLAARCSEMGVDCIEVDAHKAGVAIPTWGPESPSDTCNLGPSTLCITKTDFWLRAYPKHASHEINTTAINIVELIKALLNNEQERLFFGGYPESLQAEWEDHALQFAISGIKLTRVDPEEAAADSPAG